MGERIEEETCEIPKAILPTYNSTLYIFSPGPLAVKQKRSFEDALGESEYLCVCVSVCLCVYSESVSIHACISSLTAGNT